MRRRDLSDEERALWDSVAKQAKPLRKKRSVRAAPSSLSTGEKPTPKAAGEGAHSPKPIHPVSPSATAHKPSPTRGVGAIATASRAIKSLDRRERTRLARGHREIDARIDLHGLTQARAHRALLGFLQRSQAEGCRYVLVITGKGKILSDGSERGVLRRMVPEWLALAEFRALVTGVEEASMTHGGAGALYVRVRRG